MKIMNGSILFLTIGINHTKQPCESSKIGFLEIPSSGSFIPFSFIHNLKWKRYPCLKCHKEKLHKDPRREKLRDFSLEAEKNAKRMLRSGVFFSSFVGSYSKLLLCMIGFLREEGWENKVL